jgi:Flp pilus assembly protein TadG
MSDRQARLRHPPHRPSAGAADRGAVTAETALAVPSLVLVLLLAVWVLLGVTAQLRCLDAAHLGARAAARGESDQQVRSTVARVAPDGASVRVTRSEGVVEVRVSAEVRPFADVLGALPGLPVAGRAVAADEAAITEPAGAP